MVFFSHLAAATKDNQAVKLMIRRVIKTAAEIAQEVADAISASFNQDNPTTITQHVNTGIINTLCR